MIVRGNVCIEIPPVVEANLNTPVKENLKSPNSFNINLATSETNTIVSSHITTNDCSFSSTCWCWTSVERSD